MKNLHATLAACVVAGVLIIGTPNAHAADVTVGANVNSAYVWRGITLNDGAVIQPSIDVEGPGNFGFFVWGNFDLDDFDNSLESGEFSEIDLTASYAIPVDGFDLGVGIIEYLFPDSGPGASGVGTREVYVEAGYDLTEELAIGSFVAYDFDEVDDYYANVSASYAIMVSEELGLALTGLIGFAGDKFALGPDSGVHEYDISLAASYAASANTELGAYVAFTDSADSGVLPDQKTDVYGGISAYYGF